MKILRNTDTQNISLELKTNFEPYLGKEESLIQFEEETITSLINPIENYETIRLENEPYYGITTNQNDLECDLWHYFYFYNGDDHNGGLDYTLGGISLTENLKMLKQSTKSFFRLEFYKVPDGEIPDKSNRRLAFAKNLSIPNGEKVLYRLPSEYIFVPIFMGNNYKNTENMFLFWFKDEDVLLNTVLTGNTFYMTARFFNQSDGSIINFGNKSKSITDKIIESADLYYQVIINKSNYTYTVLNYDGTDQNRFGFSNNPIKFYEISGG